MRVILILVDGMRPDALGGIPAAQALAARSAHTFAGRTVFPSVTLPCHMSLFHSVDPDRHGTTGNTYAPQVRPVTGLYEVLQMNGLRSAMFYDWEQLRDLGRPGSLAKSLYLSMGVYGFQDADDMLTDAAIGTLRTDDLDFIFLYLGAPDNIGHDHGWMGEEYMQAIADAWKNIERVAAVLKEDDYLFVTADHGGHGRSHGTEMKEDMEIPFFMAGPGIEAEVLPAFSIMDIAPTVCRLFGVRAPREWEGAALL